MPRDAPLPEPSLVCVLGMRGMPGIMGGVESHCEELLPRLARRAPGLRIVALGRRPYMGKARRMIGGVAVVPLPSPRRQSVETLVSSFVAVLYARRIGAAAVHIHALASGLFAPLARLLGMKVILTVHGADYQRAKWGRAARTLLRIGERAGVGSADAVICVAPSLTEDLRRRYPARSARIAHVPNGAPRCAEDESGGQLMKQLGIEPGEFVLAVGRLEPGKGFEVLIDAFRRSGRKGKLVIVGGAHHEAKYAAELMKAADDRVIFAGVQPRGALFELYRNAALFVLPSLHEGLPICVLEAASAGCPVLLSDIPGSRDLGLAEHHYFRSGDVDSLARALDIPEERLIVADGAFDAFDWDRIADRTLGVYESVIAPRPS